MGIRCQGGHLAYIVSTSAKLSTQSGPLWDQEGWVDDTWISAVRMCESEAPGMAANSPLLPTPDSQACKSANCDFEAAVKEPKWSSSVSLQCLRGSYSFHQTRVKCALNTGLSHMPILIINLRHRCLCRHPRGGPHVGAAIPDALWGQASAGAAVQARHAARPDLQSQEGWAPQFLRQRAAPGSQGKAQPLLLQLYII